MEYIVTINSLEEIERLNYADSYLFGNNSFSIYSIGSFPLNNLKKIVEKIHFLNKKAYILVNKIFFDNELDKLYKHLKQLKEINVDGIFFSDFAVYQIAKKLNICHLLIFYHETLSRNSYDINEFINLNIKKVIISKDANLEDIKKLKNKEKLGISIFGYFPIYYSKRKVLTNQKNTYKLKINKQEIFQLKEQKREELYYLIENKNGSVIFNAFPLNYYNYLNVLKNYVSSFIINSSFFDLDSINEFINKCKNGSAKTIDEIFKNQEFTEGFLINKVGVK